MATMPRLTCANPRCGKPLAADNKSGFCSKQCQRNHERFLHPVPSSARAGKNAPPRRITLNRFHGQDNLE